MSSIYNIVLGQLGPERLPVSVCIVPLPGLLPSKSQAFWAQIVNLYYLLQIILSQRAYLLSYGSYSGPLWSTLMGLPDFESEDRGWWYQTVLSWNVQHVDRFSLFCRQAPVVNQALEGPDLVKTQMFLLYSSARAKDMFILHKRDYSDDYLKNICLFQSATLPLLMLKSSDFQRLSIREND